MSMRKLFVLSLIVFVLWSRFHFRSEYLYTWDSVQFALSLEKFDVRLHQPHPPGYILYSYTMRLMHWIIPDVNLAFISFNIVATIGACFLIFCIVKFLLSARDPSKQFLCSAAASLLYATAPVSWLYGCVAEIYAVEAFFVCLVMYLAFRSEEQPVYMIGASAALAVAGGFRPSTEVFLLPFYLISLIHRPKAIIARSLVVLFVINAAWFAFLSSTVGGPEKYFHLLRQQFTLVENVTNALNQQTDVLSRPLFIVLFRLIQVITLPIFIALLLRIHKIRFDRSLLRIMLAFVPGLLFFMFVHMTKDGYLLMIIPGAILFGVILLERLYAKSSVLAVVLFLGCMLNYYAFTRPPLMSADEVRTNPVKHISALLTTPNKHVIRAHNARLHDFFKRIDGLHAASKLFIVRGDFFPGWRLIMYYYPQDDSILVNPGSKMVTLANQREVQRLKQPIEVSQQVVIAVGPQEPEIRMSAFDVYEYRYYYSRKEDLPGNFRLYSLQFRVTEDRGTASRQQASKR